MLIQFLTDFFIYLFFLSESSLIHPNVKMDLEQDRHNTQHWGIPGLENAVF